LLDAKFRRSSLPGDARRDRSMLRTPGADIGKDKRVLPHDGYARRMAQTIEVKLVDDIDGSNADETVVFGLDGKAYEIELSRKNASVLRKALASYIAIGRLAGRTPAPGRSRSTGGPTERVRRQDSLLRAQRRGEGRLPGVGQYANCQARRRRPSPGVKPGAETVVRVY